MRQNRDVPKVAMHSACGRFLRRSQIVTYRREKLIAGEMRNFRVIALQHFASLPVYSRTTLNATECINERGFADRLDEGSHRLCPFGRTRSHQSSDGTADARLSDAGSAYGPGVGAGPWSFEASCHSCLEYAWGTRL